MDTALTSDVTANDIPVEIPDEQLDKFFESGGKEPLIADEPEAEPVQEATQPEEKPAEEAQQDKDFERNYKAAMHEERERRKDMQRALEEQRQRADRLEQTFQKLVERANQANQPQPPNFEEDPIEALRYEQQKIKQMQAERDNYLVQKEQYEQQQRAQMEFVNKYRASANEYAKTQVDFPKAYQYLVETRREEFLTAGYSPEYVEQLIHEDEAAIVANAFQTQKNPAEVIYNLAKKRGYQLTDAQPVQKNEQKLEQMEKGLQASKSLGNVSGKAAKDHITLEDLASIEDDDEFSKLFDKIVKRK
jgi:hypothetical protein